MPGPGHFNPNDTLFKDTRGTRFGSSKRYDVAKGNGEGPGPGNYTYTDRSLLQSAPAYSMVGRNGKGGLEKSDSVPGPG